MIKITRNWKITINHYRVIVRKIRKYNINCDSRHIQFGYHFLEYRKNLREAFAQWDLRD